MKIVKTVAKGATVLDDFLIRALLGGLGVAGLVAGQPDTAVDFDGSGDAVGCRLQTLFQESSTGTGPSTRYSCVTSLYCDV